VAGRLCAVPLSGLIDRLDAIGSIDVEVNVLLKKATEEQGTLKIMALRLAVFLSRRRLWLGSTGCQDLERDT